MIVQCVRYAPVSPTPEDLGIAARMDSVTRWMYVRADIADAEYMYAREDQRHDERSAARPI